jgi:hypothetical protein
MDAEMGTTEGEELDVLVDLVELYEASQLSNGISIRELLTWSVYVADTQAIAARKSAEAAEAERDTAVAENVALREALKSHAVYIADYVWGNEGWCDLCDTRAPTVDEILIKVHAPDCPLSNPSEHASKRGPSDTD